MNIEKFNLINDFFKDKVETTQFEKDFVIRKVYENYYHQIYMNDESGNRVKKSDLEIEAIELTLVSKENLQSYLDSANSFYIKWLDGKEKIIVKQSQRGSFWKSVWIGIVSNLLYSLFLIIVFVVAKSQITSWLQSLTGGN